MKFKGKTWILIAVVLAIGVVAFGWRRERFVSRSRFAALKEKGLAAGVGPEPLGFMVLLPADDNFTISQSDLDSIKNGTWDIAEALTSRAEDLAEFAGVPPEARTSFIQDMTLDRFPTGRPTRRSMILRQYKESPEFRAKFHSEALKVFTVRGSTSGMSTSNSPSSAMPSMASSPPRPAPGGAMSTPLVTAPTLTFSQNVAAGSYMLQPTRR